MGTLSFAMAETDRILAGLNPQQRQAVQATEGPLLILAGAGSGKTSVLTRRIAYLMAAKRVAPWSILAITFTNKAAKEMRERIEKLVGLAASDIWATTFHSMCVRILRRDIERLGYQSGFSILDDTDQLSTVKRILSDLNIDTKQFEPRAILSRISAAKNELRSAAQMADGAGNPFEKVAGNVYLEYERRLKINNSLDFDDLIMKTVHLFESAPDVLEFYHNKFHYIHVDEYQDTNRAQYRLVSLLAKRRQNLCVVGDSDQSIYGWRGADIKNILSFERDYPQAQVIRLEQNYRSTKTILNIANDVIKNNVERPSKNLWTENAEGARAVLFQAADERMEARFIVERILQHQRGSGHYADVAILYRTNAQSRVIEEVFLQEGVPYRIFGGVKFYDRKEIRDVVAYLRLILNPQDDISLLRIINVPRRGIGATTVAKVQELATRYGLSLFAAFGQAERAGVSGRALKTISAFVQMMENLVHMRGFLTVTELTEEVLKQTGYREALKAEKTLEAEARVENLNEFLSVTMEFDADFAGVGEELANARLEAFLTDVALVSDVDLNGGKPVKGNKAGETEGNEDKVVLMTLHSAKGLEFPVVFLVGLEEGVFPHSRALNSNHDMEEERRLCYVGVTRAEANLYLTTCSTRMLFGQLRAYAPSRFLAEMPEMLIERVQPEMGVGRMPWAPRARMQGSLYTGKDALMGSQSGHGSTGGFRVNGGPHGGTMSVPSNFGADLSVEYLPGDKVEHRKWGLGTIAEADSSGTDLELVIDFAPPIGRRKLVARFAPIQKVE